MVEQRATVEKNPRHRSPSYPGIGLEESLDKARIVYKHEGRHAAPVETIVQHWGYKGLSGPAKVAIAALRKFGFLVDEGSGTARRARLSSDAITIVRDDREDGSERQQLLREAALKPTIHRELWERYGGQLPSDSNLRFELLQTYGFTESGAREFIAQFKGTLAFTGLDRSGTLGPDSRDKPETGERESMPPAALAPPGPPAPPTDSLAPAMREIQIPIALDEWVTLKAAFPLTDEKWKQLTAVLDAMKPALVAPAKRDSGFRQVDAVTVFRRAAAEDVESDEDEGEDEDE